MKDPRVVEIEFLSDLDQNHPPSLTPWDYEKKLGVTKEFFLAMVYGLFLDRCLEGVSAVSAPHPSYAYGGDWTNWGSDQRSAAVLSLLSYSPFVAYINHRGRVRLWQLRDEVQKARTKEKFGILWDRRHWDAEVLIQLAMKDQTKTSAVLFMDLNNFKKANDKYGHAVGDEVLKICYQTVLTLVGTAGDVSGWGGDEVVVFVREMDREAVDRLVEAIKTAVAKECSAHPVLAENNHLIAVACGTYVFSDGQSPAEIVIAADKLMYADKEEMKAGMRALESGPCLTAQWKMETQQPSRWASA